MPWFPSAPGCTSLHIFCKATQELLTRNPLLESPSTDQVIRQILDNIHFSEVFTNKGDRIFMVKLEQSLQNFAHPQ